LTFFGLGPQPSIRVDWGPKKSGGPATIFSREITGRRADTDRVVSRRRAQKNIVTMAVADDPQHKIINSQQLSSFTFTSIERGYVRRRRQKQYFAGRITHSVACPFWLFFTQKYIVTMAAADGLNAIFTTINHYDRLPLYQ
jgi:hypothetical protein